MNDTERADQAKETPQITSTVIETQFPAEGGGQTETQIPIFIRFLHKKGKILNASTRDWNWRAQSSGQGGLVIPN